MKKLFSISIAFIMLLSGLQLTVSMHYCGGELAGSKVSLIGQIASCGMESDTEDCMHASAIEETSCCKNSVSVYEADHNYSPSFTEFKAFSQTVLQVYLIPENYTSQSLTSSDQHFTDTGPPENYLASAVILPKICVFRI